MNRKLEEAERFRRRAEELRTVAARFSLAYSDMITSIAADYDRLAELSERTHPLDSSREPQGR